MRIDPDITFLATLTAAAILLALALGACGGAQRRDCAVNRTGDMGSRCTEDGR